MPKERLHWGIIEAVSTIRGSVHIANNPIKRWLEKKENRGAIDLYNSDKLKYT